MKAEPLSQRLHIRMTARLKAALQVLFEEDPKPYRSLSDFVVATLERLARERLPHFFESREDLSGERPAIGRQPVSRPPRRGSASAKGTADRRTRRDFSLRQAVSGTGALGIPPFRSVFAMLAPNSGGRKALPYTAALGVVG